MRGGSVIQMDFCEIRTLDSSSFDIHTEPYQAGMRTQGVSVPTFPFTFYYAPISVSGMPKIL
jgi:hypothetical protein